MILPLALELLPLDTDMGVLETLGRLERAERDPHVQAPHAFLAHLEERVRSARFAASRAVFVRGCRERSALRAQPCEVQQLSR